MVSFSERAAAKIKQILAENKIKNTIFRLRVKSALDDVVKYELHSERTHLDGDDMFTSHGLTIVVDPLSMNHVDGGEIDYSDQFRMFFSNSDKINCKFGPVGGSASRVLGAWMYF